MCATTPSHSSAAAKLQWLTKTNSSPFSLCVVKLAALAIERLSAALVVYPSRSAPLAAQQNTRRNNKVTNDAKNSSLNKLRFRMRVLVLRNSTSSYTQ
jgi:hypothetical protein